MLTFKTVLNIAVSLCSVLLNSLVLFFGVRAVLVAVCVLVEADNRGFTPLCL